MTEGGDGPETRRWNGTEVPIADCLSAAERNLGTRRERMRLEEISVGQTAEFTKTVTETDVVLFAGITGDFNPAHVNEVEAGQGMFGGRIAHGMLSAGFISTVLAMRLPGPGAIYLSQNLRFVRPVRIGDTVTARVEVAEVIAPRRRVRLSTTVANHRGENVIHGEAVVMIPE